jgi:hypothetical protein
MRKTALASPGMPAGLRSGTQPAWLRIDLLAGVLAFVFLAVTLMLSYQPSALPALSKTSSQASHAYGKLPLSFIPNKGQTNESVRYYAEGHGFGFYFTDHKAVLSMQKGERGQALDLRFLGASPNATLVAERQGQGKVNYLRGDDPSKWQSGLPTYGQLAYQGLWPGVDMHFRGSGGKLKYEFALKPGAQPDRVRLAYAGAQGLSLASAGSLLVQTPLGTLRDSKPRAWQTIGGRKVAVESRYSLLDRAGGAPAYGFALGAYDHSRPLVIDPGLAYSTFLGGSSTDQGIDITVDANGSAYVTGRVDSAGFPTTAGAFDTSHNGGADAFVSKLSPDGSTLEYSTFLGGSSTDLGNGITVDGSGNAYVTGETDSANFPTTPGSLDTTRDGNGDAFVTKLSADGASPSYSTYLGGTGNIDAGNAITIDGSGNAYITGDTISNDFPTTPGAFDTTGNNFTIYQGFVTKLDPAGAALVYSTYLDGSGSFDFGNAVAVDGSGNAYIGGSTSSTNFPTTPGAYDTTQNGDDDGFVTKLNASGSALTYSTYLGGNTFDGVSDLALDGSGNVYLTGSTSSSDFPTTPGSFDTSYNSDTDAFVTKLNATGSGLTYSTFLGGFGTQTTGYDAGSGIGIDDLGRAYVTGRTDAVNFPTTAGAYDTIYNGVGDVFLTRFDAAGSALTYSTYLGGTSTDWGYGIAVQGEAAYMTGYTSSSDYPTNPQAFDTTSNGGNDAFVTKFDLSPSGYARPKSATPTVVRLVPAYTQCSAGNSLHGSPLVQPSCAPPAPASNYLTVGTADSNGKPTNSSGFVQLKVLGETPINPGNGDQADVEITLQLGDVRNKGGLSDYTGQLQGVLGLRITDRLNGPDENLPATVTDTPLRFPVSCTPTDSTATGSDCNVVTSADTLMAGLAREGKRAVWGLSQVQVFDGGADGDVETADNTLFETQGTFAP